MSIERTRPTRESAEQEDFSRGFEGASARLLMGGEAFNPQHEVAEIDTSLLGTPDTRDYSPFQAASIYERTVHWRGREGDNFEAQKSAWIQDTVGRFTSRESRDFFNTQKGQAWSNLYSRLGINTATFNSEEAGRFYSTYLRGGDGMGIRQFVSDVRGAYIGADGSIDVARMTREMGAIRWISRVFGENSSEVISLLTQAEGQASTEQGRVQLVDSVSVQIGEKMRVNALTGAEGRVLSTFWSHLQEGRRVINNNSSPRLEEPNARSDARRPDTRQTPEQEEEYRRRVESLIDYGTGKVREGVEIDMADSYTEAIRRVEQEIENNPDRFSANIPTIVYSKEARILIDKMARESNNKDAELAFTFRGVRVERNGRTVFVVAYAVPASDYVNPRGRDVTIDPGLEMENARKIAMQTGVRETYRRGATGDRGDVGENFGTYHTHQISLGRGSIQRPSRRDYIQVDQTLSRRHGQPFQWGIFTMTPEGNKSVLFSSRRKDGQIVHEKMRELEIDSIPARQNIERQRREEVRVPDISAEENVIAANEFIRVLRDPARLTLREDGNRPSLVHEFGHEIPGRDAARGWFEGISTLRMAQERYNMPFGMYIHNRHARTLLKPPYQDADGVWKALVYDPMHSGEEEVPLPRYGEYMRNNKMLLNDKLMNSGIAVNQLALRSIESGDYDLSISADRRLGDQREEFVSAKLRALQVDGHNCIPYSLFVNTMLQAMRPGDSRFKQEGLRRIQEDFGIHVKTFEEIMRGGQVRPDSESGRVRERFHAERVREEVTRNAERFVNVLRDPAKLTEQGDFMEHEFGNLFSFDRLTSWFDARPDAMNQRYQMRIAEAGVANHSRLMLQSPRRGDDGVWRVLVYDPFNEGERQVVVRNWQANMHQLSSEEQNRIIDSNQFVQPLYADLREKIVNGTYDISISGNPAVPENRKREIMRAFLPKLQNGAGDCVPYVYYIGAILSALQPGQTAFKARGIQQFEQDFGFRPKTVEELF